MDYTEGLLNRFISVPPRPDELVRAQEVLAGREVFKQNTRRLAATYWYMRAPIGLKEAAARLKQFQPVYCRRDWFADYPHHAPVVLAALDYRVHTVPVPVAKGWKGCEDKRVYLSYEGPGHDGFPVAYLCLKKAKKDLVMGRVVGEDYYTLPVTLGDLDSLAENVFSDPAGEASCRDLFSGVGASAQGDADPHNELIVAENEGAIKSPPKSAVTLAQTPYARTPQQMSLFPPTLHFVT